MKKNGKEFDFFQSAPLRKEEKYEAYCGECRRKYIADEEYIADRECCPECFKLFQTPAGRAENKKRRARMIEKLSGLQESFTPPADEMELEYKGEF